MAKVLEMRSEEYTKLVEAEAKKGNKVYLCSPYRLAERIAKGYKAVFVKKDQVRIVEEFNTGEEGLILCSKPMLILSDPIPAGEKDKLKLVMVVDTPNEQVESAALELPAAEAPESIPDDNKKEEECSQSSPE